MNRILYQNNAEIFKIRDYAYYRTLFRNTINTMAYLKLQINFRQCLFQTFE